jgi:type I restriction enzyme S subunit
MKNGWKEMHVGEILQLEYGKPLDESDRKPNGRFPVYGANGEKDRTDKFYCKNPSIIVGRKGSAGEINLTEEIFWPLDVTYFVKFDEKKHDLRFLYYLLTKLDLPKLAKGVKPGINRNEVYSIVVKAPSLSEQQRIVGILDEAFEAIATAKANAEKNLQNARAIFESHLHSVFTQRGEGWVKETIGDVCILRSGTTLPKEIEKSSGEIPYLKVADMNISENLNGVTCSSRYVNKNDVNASNLLPIGTTIFPKRGGAILTNKKRLTERVICADLNIMGVTPRTGLLPEFLFNFFLQLDLREINNGSSIPQINNYSIEPLTITFPTSITDQKAIVDKLESLSVETERLESIYHQELAALDALKKSLFNQAFSGKL